MQLFLIWMMIFMFHAGSSEDLVKPFKDVMLAVEGDTVTLSCNYSGSVYSLFWYQQKSSSSPQFLIGEGSEKTRKLSVSHDRERKEFHLQIISAAVTDSAVYYCALTSGSGNFKLMFGEGIKLTIETKELAEPDYYKLEGNGTTACLATGFTRQNGTADHTYFEEYFNKTAAVRVGDDKVYNQVALLSDDGDKCEKGSGSEATPCEDSIKPDPTVNFVSVTVLCLRVIFIKTIVFNVLLTFRLWISQ